MLTNMNFRFNILQLQNSCEESQVCGNRRNGRKKIVL